MQVTDGYMCFELADGKSIVLDCEQVQKTQEEILEKYQIPGTHSKDLDDIIKEVDEDVRTRLVQMTLILLCVHPAHCTFQSLPQLTWLVFRIWLHLFADSSGCR